MVFPLGHFLVLFAFFTGLFFPLCNHLLVSHAIRLIIFAQTSAWKPKKPKDILGKTCHNPSSLKSNEERPNDMAQ